MSQPSDGRAAEDPAGRDLEGKVARGTVVSALGQAAALVLRTGSVMLLARLVLPRDFGLVGMVTAFTGMLGLFRDVGLSAATVQRESVTDEQTSTLFWINLAIGALMAGLCCAAAPLFVRFYGEPRLFWIAIAIGAGFLFNGAGAQHRAILQRAMRFRALASVDTAALVLSIGIATSAALAGAGYWSIVLMTVCVPILGTAGLWLATKWTPGPPRRRTGIRPMLWYGGTVTLTSVIVYLAYNADKILLGRVWGAEALGVYGRAYQLANMPTENLSSTVGLVVFPALARVQQDPEQLRTHFLRSYGFFLSLSVPITAGCLLFAEDIVQVFLGPRWTGAAGPFRLLAPTILASAVINPLGWLMMATGQTAKSLKIALVFASIVIGGYSLGLGSGPSGVAVGFSVSMLLAVVPVVMWATHGTSISAADMRRTVARPLVSIAGAAAGAYAVSGWTGQLEPAFLRLTVNSLVLFVLYLVALLWGFNQKAIYLPTLRQSGLWPDRLSGLQRP